MNRRFGLGYRKDPAHLKTQRMSVALLGASPTVPPAFSARQFEAPIFDQNYCGSCGGHGSSQALVVAFAKAGKPLPFIPSPGDIYRVARAIERARETPSGKPLPALQDVGSFPSDITQGLARYGVRAMKAPSPQGFYSDIDPSNVNDEVSLADIEADGQRIVTGQFRIEPLSQTFIPQLRAGIYQVGAVGVGVFVDSAFFDWDPSSGPLDAPHLNLEDPDGGGHWLCADEYETMPDGTIIVSGPNSWTTAWGDEGRWRVTDRWLQKACTDSLVFHVADALPEAA